MQNRNLLRWKTALLGRAYRRFVTGIFCVGMILVQEGIFAQCSTNLSVRTYDTVLTGSGYGTYNLKFPKWNSDSGLLVSVKISAVVNVQYGFSLKNVDTMAGTYGIWVGREDYFTSPALSAAYDNTNEQKIGTYTLNPGAQASMSPFPFLTNFANVDSITGNTAPFLGSGLLNFTYSPITYTNIHTSNNASYSYHATATDQTHFSLSYIYCNGGGVLASSLTAFTAALKEPALVQLNWSVVGEEGERIYEIQRSGDGVSFATVGSRPAEPAGIGSVDYTFADRLTGPGGPAAWANGGMSSGPASGKLYYRLRIVNAASVSYSPIRSVNLGSNGSDKLILFPNPARDHINVVMPDEQAATNTGGGNRGAGGSSGNPGVSPGTPGDWMVNIRAADGRLVQSANFFHSNNLPIFFHQNLSPGIYFIRVTDLQGGNGRVASFRVDPR